MTQISLPVEVTPAEIARKRSLGQAITLCYEAAGFEPKQVTSALGVDKGQLSRWESGGEGVVWGRLCALMDHCGNDAPLLWMVHARNWDLHSMRRRESELERRLRQAEEENAALRRVLLGKGAA